MKDHDSKPALDNQDDPVLWQGDLNDDCTAVWHGLMLRAEAMDARHWWWAVSMNEGKREEIGSSRDEKGECTSGKTARSRAEACARKYLTRERYREQSGSGET